MSSSLEAKLCLIVKETTSNLQFILFNICVKEKVAPSCGLAYFVKSVDLIFF